MFALTAPRAVLRQLQLPLVCFSADGTLIDVAPEIAELALSDRLIKEIRADALAAFARAGHSSRKHRCWRSSIPRTNPLFVVHGAIVSDELGSFEAIAVLLPNRVQRQKPRAGTPYRNIEQFLTESGLTPREAEVAMLITEGQSSPQIAFQMRITVHTVRRHTEAVFRKLRVHTRTELGRVVGFATAT